MKTYKTILLGSIIGLLMFPTITFGGSFVASLISGKTPEEAVVILANQLDILIGRVETVETKQAVLEAGQTELQTQQEAQDQAVADLQAVISQQQVEQEKQKACKKADDLFKQAEVVYGQGLITAIVVNDFIVDTQTMIDELKSIIPICFSKYGSCDTNEYQMTLDRRSFEIDTLQTKLLQLKTINSDFVVQYNLCNEE